MRKSVLCKLVAVSFLALPVMTVAANRTGMPVKPIEMLPDSTALSNHFRALGYKTHGGVDRASSDQIGAEGRTFPTFSSAFSVGGVAYPFTMFGGWYTFPDPTSLTVPAVYCN